MALIYAVEDDKNILEIEMFALKNSGYQVEGFENASDFYKKLREKKMIKTSAINMQTFKNVFEEYLANGLDLLYIGMSAGLSATFGSAVLAAN